MGTYAVLSLAAPLSRPALLSLSEPVYSELARLDRKYSFHRPDSLLTRINQQAARAGELAVDAETVELLSAALALSCLSDGHFDVCVGAAMLAQGALPDHFQAPGLCGHSLDVELDAQRGRVRFHRPLLIDLGGFAKGHAVDAALDRLPAAIDAVLNVGGDLRMQPWQGRTVWLRGPRAEAEYARPMAAPAVASSVAAPGPQLGLVIDPHKGMPLQAAISCSVFADSARLADGLTKWALQGAEPAQLWAAGARALVRIERDGGLQEWQAAPVGSAHGPRAVEVA